MSRGRRDDPDFGEPESADEPQPVFTEIVFVVGEETPDPTINPAENHEVWGKRDDRVADELAARLGAFRRVPLFVQYGKSPRVGHRDRCSDFSAVSIIRPESPALIEDARTIGAAFGLTVEIVDPEPAEQDCSVTYVTEGTASSIRMSLDEYRDGLRRASEDHVATCPRCRSSKSQPYNTKKNPVIDDQGDHMSISSRARQIPFVGHMSVDVYLCNECDRPVLVSETARPGKKDARCEVTYDVGEVLGARTVVIYANPASVSDGDDIRVEVVREDAGSADSYFGHWATEIMPAIAPVVNGHGDGCSNRVNDFDRPAAPTGVRALHFGMGKKWGVKTR